VVIESNRVPAYWPSSSNSEQLLVVENLEVKYAPELPAVLHDVSFTLKAGERVGLLGRTGSIKSCLLCNQVLSVYRKWKIYSCNECFEICAFYNLRSTLNSRGWL